MNTTGPTKAQINRALDLLAADFEAAGATDTQVNHLLVCPDCDGEGYTNTPDGPELCFRCDGQG